MKAGNSILLLSGEKVPGELVHFQLLTVIDILAEYGRLVQLQQKGNSIPQPTTDETPTHQAQDPV
jgi:hypothetical protein